MSKNSKSRKILLTINIIALIGLSGATAYLFMENRDLQEQATLSNEEKNQRIIDEVNEVYSLPDEDPVIGYVKDVDKFKNDFPAFENDDVKLDDILLFYRKARLNVLYRQSEKRVVKTANVAVPFSVELVGSEKAISDAEKKLGKFNDQITITKTVSDGITQSFVIDVEGDQSAVAEAIAEELKYEIGSTLPSNIQANDQTEIVIIVKDSTTKPTTEQTP